MRHHNIHIYLALAVLLATFGCEQKENKLFAIRYGSSIGITFQNTINTNDTLNPLTYEYIYNGSGVGVGDFNNDGLDDLFFGGNQVSSRLYLNKGQLQFEDITTTAGVLTDRWVTGVSIIDINRDGWLDIFLAVAGRPGTDNMNDLLFINQGAADGVPSFKESANAFGIDDDGYGTMGAFFDYDKDGDNDLYLVRNALESFNRNNLRPKRIHGEASSTDRMYRNNGDNTFTDVSKDAGITIEGYGLGVNICDLNQDSWPDIYVSNDFMSNDLLWINQKDGTFRNMAGDFMKHQTHNGMGVDIADFNNDALPDIMVVDMLPPGHSRQKMMTASQNYDHFHMAEKMGYQPQYMRNTLQLNRGKFPDGRVLFSEIAFAAGVSSTDWSWAPLFADFDNDGLKDLFIANGYRKDVTDLDFIFFGLKGASPFGTTEKRQQKINDELKRLPEVKLPNYIFRNTGTLLFEDKSKEWGVDVPSFSNGAAYADFDNDGDLDIITNNIDQEVILYENTLQNKNSRTSANHFLRLRNKDKSSFGHKVWVYCGGTVQFFESTPYRGFQSTVGADLHIGTGASKMVDSIKILWPDNGLAVYRQVKGDSLLTYSRADAVVTDWPHVVGDSPGAYFQESASIDFVHREKSEPDIKLTRTLLHELTRLGPCSAVGDVNNDKLDDVFIGGERGTSARLFIQSANGTFKPTPLYPDSTREDGDALFFDADGDSDLDLYIASACSSSMTDPEPHLLLVNNGRGEIKRSTLIPRIISSASCVVAEDFDKDGDLDLFVGGRIKPREYPLSPRSYLLRNDNGRFIDITEKFCPSLMSPGMISAAVWADVDKDSRKDLVVAGEWMPITIFINEGTKMSDQTKSFGLDSTNGWWNCLRVADLNNDGFEDIVAGNTGKNSFFKPSRAFPVKITAKDFDSNGSIDPLVTYYNPVEKDRFMVHNRLVLIDQVPGFKRRFETFRKYASTTFEKAFRADEIEGAYEQKIYHLHRVCLSMKGEKN